MTLRSELKHQWGRLVCEVVGALQLRFTTLIFFFIRESIILRLLHLNEGFAHELEDRGGLDGSIRIRPVNLIVRMIMVVASLFSCVSPPLMLPDEVCQSDILLSHRYRGLFAALRLLNGYWRHNHIHWRIAFSRVFASLSVDCCHFLISDVHHYLLHYLLHHVNFADSIFAIFLNLT